MGVQCSNCGVCQVDKSDFMIDSIYKSQPTEPIPKQSANNQSSSQNLDKMSKTSVNCLIYVRNYEQDTFYQEKAIVIQALARGYLTRKKLRRLNKENQLTAQANADQKLNLQTCSFDRSQPQEQNGQGMETPSFRMDVSSNKPIFNNQNHSQSVRLKLPKQKLNNGASYEGEWLDGMKDGYGVQVWPDGAKYEGEWKQDKAHGKGKFFHSDGDIYIGEWANDQADGYGEYFHSNGGNYKGQWMKDQKHGYGIDSWVDGSKYEGEFVEGFRHGQGRFLKADLSLYDGQWDKNQISGQGVLKWPDGRVYKGDWVNSKMHGKGEYLWTDGRKYEGEFDLDKKQGFGIYTWADGRVYEGQWLSGKQHGQGKYTSRDGSTGFGVWQAGKRIEWLTT